MSKVIFYSPITSESAENFIRDLDFRSSMQESVDVVINSPGGSVDAGWGMIKAFIDFPFEKEIHVHGSASSMMAAFLLWSKKVTALRQSTFILHRARSPFSGEAVDKTVNHINSEMRKAFESKLNIVKFEEVSGVTLDRFFDNEQERVDVVLTGEEALAVGLVSSLEDLNSSEIKAINDKIIEANESNKINMLAIPEESNTISNKNKNQMENQFTQSDVDAAKKLAADAAVTAYKKAETDRVAGWNLFSDVDAEAVAKGVASGLVISAAEITQFTAMRASTAALELLKQNNAPDLDQNEPQVPVEGDLSPEAEAAISYENDLRSALGLGE